MKNTIKGVCLSRIERYSNIIQKVIKDSYNYIKKYVNKGSIEEEERNKRKAILSELKKKNTRKC